ncbi:MAG: hypothetical protein ONB17_03770 [candidate division KSB1 bacterium]|nr:hypothetical protein [candidate division KSB1 bacterium]
MDESQFPARIDGSTLRQKIVNAQMAYIMADLFEGCKGPAGAFRRRVNKKIYVQSSAGIDVDGKSRSPDYHVTHFMSA